MDLTRHRAEMLMLVAQKARKRSKWVTRDFKLHQVLERLRCTTRKTGQRKQATNSEARWDAAQWYEEEGAGRQLIWTSIHLLVPSANIC